MQVAKEVEENILTAKRLKNKTNRGNRDKQKQKEENIPST